MQYFYKITVLILSILHLTSCSSLSNTNFNQLQLADKNAELQTKILFERIREIPNKGIAFGQQDATMYGINWKPKTATSKLKSDIKEVSGKMPAIHGFDLGHIELGASSNLDTVSFDLIKNHVRKLNKKGAIITFSWHADNPKSMGSSWDTTSVVKTILKGCSERSKYESWVARLSTFFKSLKTSKGTPIPVVFRPFHEMNGNWFWWGEGNCTPEEYKELWRETFYLLKQNGVTNLLYAYAPNIMQSSEEFDLYYPGDDFVDILGVDIYNYGGREAFINNIQKNLAILKEKAIQKNKPFALTETGNVNSGSEPNWWTKSLYPGIENSGAAWVLLWRNARLDHYFSVYPEDISVPDFKEFARLDELLFLKKIKKINY